MENRGNKRTNTNYSFMYKVALPESKSLTDECRTPSLEHTGLAWQGRAGEGSPWESQGHAEFWDAPNPTGHPTSCRHHLPRLFQLLLAFNMMMSQCHILNAESRPGLSKRLRCPALLWVLWWASCQLLPVTSQGRP